MQSRATRVTDYLAELPTDRRAAISAVRDVIRANLATKTVKKSAKKTKAAAR